MIRHVWEQVASRVKSFKVTVEQVGIFLTSKILCMYHRIINTYKQTYIYNTVYTYYQEILL